MTCKLLSLIVGVKTLLGDFLGTLGYFLRGLYLFVLLSIFSLLCLTQSCKWTF